MTPGLGHEFAPGKATSESGHWPGWHSGTESGLAAEPGSHRNTLRKDGAVIPLRRAGAPGPPENATKRCDFYWVCPGAPKATGAAAARLERVQAQRLHEAGAAGARAQRGHGGDRVAHDDAQAELVAPIALGSKGEGDDARDPRGVRAQPPPVGEAEQGVGEGEAGDVRGDLGAGGVVHERGGGASVKTSLCVSTTPRCAHMCSHPLS